MCNKMIRVGFTFMVTLVARCCLSRPHAQSVHDWKWQATVYGWFPSIGGKTSFPLDGFRVNIDRA